ncbi:MAG: hypothetical protein AB7P04_04960 [Bacteriovoracia bacterium]
MPVANLDREKYLKIMRAQGYSAAITQLHHDMESMEFEAFEGSKGYQPELYEDIKKFRDFSRELWELNQRDPHAK